MFGCNANPYLLGREFNQHGDAALAIGHLLDAFDTGRRRFRQTHAPARLEQALLPGLSRRFLRTQGLDQRFGHLGRLFPQLSSRLSPLVERMVTQLGAESPRPSWMRQQPSGRLGGAFRMGG